MTGIVVVFAAAVVAQPHKAEKPMALDPITQRQVYEAVAVAEVWADRLTYKTFPIPEMIGAPRERRVAFGAARRRAKHNLIVAAKIQIAEAYGISQKTLEAVVADPRSRVQVLVPEPPSGSGIRMATGAGIVMRTRFDPGKVILPDKIARASRWENPKPPKERKPLVITPEMNVRARRPGEPHATYEDSVREQVERYIEIRERAENTVIKDPAPLR